MQFRVIWEETGSIGIDEALDAGMSARVLLGAVEAIEVQLTTDPHSNGQVLSEELRFIDVTPLRAYYYIEEAGRVVKITAARRLRTV